jgi:hypothetical protein
MRRTIVWSGLTLLLSATVILKSQSPHFVTGPNASLVTGGTELGDLIVSWKEAGLGNNITATYEADANATATYACINGGGNHPSASNKETFTAPVTGTGSFSSGKNGSISAQLEVEEPGPGSFSCPSGQTMILAFVSYSAITDTDLTFHDGPAAATPGSVSSCFVSGNLASELCP